MDRTPRARAPDRRTLLGREPGPVTSVPPDTETPDDVPSAWAALAPEADDTPGWAEPRLSRRSEGAPPPRRWTGLPAIIDIEASGFGRDSYPIEVGFVLEDGRSGCTLIRPEAGWTHWDPAAEQTHGIERRLLMSRGRPVRDVALWLNTHLAGLTVYSDGWAHDYPWLARLFDAADLLPRFRVGHLRTLLDEAQAAAWQHQLDAVRSAGSGRRHRASVDARLIRAALARTFDAGPGAPMPR